MLINPRLGVTIPSSLLLKTNPFPSSSLPSQHNRIDHGFTDTPNTDPQTPNQTLPSIKPKSSTAPAATPPSQTPQLKLQSPQLRRHFLTLSASCTLFSSFLSPLTPAFASSDEDYVKDTEDVISKVRTTITMDKKNPNVATTVADLRDASNSWVAKHRREKALLGRASFRDMYSALNVVSGHYTSFGPTAPISAKRKARILEEMDTAEKALLRGR